MISRYHGCRPPYGVQIEIKPSPDGRAHMRVFWDATNDWSGWFTSPDQAWEAAKRRVLQELEINRDCGRFTCEHLYSFKDADGFATCSKCLLRGAR